MGGTVFVAPLVTGLMHARWNAIVKVDLDRFSSILLIALAPGGIAPLLLPLFRIPAQDS